MVKSATTIPHVTNFDDADVTELENLRKTIPPMLRATRNEAHGHALCDQAGGLALRQHPVVNASLDDAKEEIVYKQYVNVGVAVDTPRGLVVPVLRNADQMGMLQIAQETARLAAGAGAAEFTLEELRGGTFTISNWGRSADCTARRSSITPRWPSCYWAARVRRRPSVTARSRAGC